MLPFARAEILVPGVTIGKDSIGQQSQQISLTQGRRTVDLLGPTDFSYMRDSLSVSLLPNEVEVRFRGISRRAKGIYPEGVEDQVGHKFTFGKDPNKPNFVEFQNPEPVMRLDFLGHPLRDVILSMMEAQAGNVGEVLGATLGSSDSGYGERIIAASPVIGTEVIPYNSSSLLENKPGYPADVMVCLVAGGNSGGPAGCLELRTMTVAKSDGLVRVYGNGEIGSFHSDKLRIFLPRMAAVGLFLKRLGSESQFPESRGLFLQRPDSEAKSRYDLELPGERITLEEFRLRGVLALHHFLYDSTVAISLDEEGLYKGDQFVKESDRLRTLATAPFS